MIKIKTIIELFDECQLENVIAGLRFRPEKIIFVGYKNIMTNKRKSDLEALFRNRGYTTEFQYEIVGRYDFDNICEKLISLAERNEDCCFDLTGGKELVLAAMGTLSERMAIPMIQFEIRSGKFIPILNCDKIEEPEPVNLSFKEITSLNGGGIVEKGSEDFEWNLTEDFKEDIRKMWNICRDNCAGWNKQTNILGGFEDPNHMCRKLEVSVSLTHTKGVRTGIPDSIFMEKLLECGLIRNYSFDEKGISFTYKNEDVQRVLTKAGNLLELYGYVTCIEIAREEKGFYDDIHNGVIVDWDGVVHDGSSSFADTHNELDIVMTRDIVPVFVSCKNGEVHKEALYELDTIARKFGGKYAKKVILTTFVAFNEKSRNHIKTRAKEMNIEFIDNVDKLSQEDFKQILKTKVR